MITVSNIPANEDPMKYSVDMSIADSSINKSYFAEFSNDHQPGFIPREGEILKATLVHASTTGTSSGKRQSRKSGTTGSKLRSNSATSNSSARNSDSTFTEATLMLDDVSSPSGSSCAASLTGSVDPVKIRLSRHEEAAFMLGQTSGEFQPNDSFGSLDEGAFNFSANHRFSSRASPAGNNKRNHLTRRYSSGSIGSRRSLSSVEEQGGMAAEAFSQDTKYPAHSRKSSIETAPTVTTDFADDASIDVATVFKKKKAKKLSPVLEAKLKGKKSSRSLRSSDSSRDSSKTNRTVGSADEILAMLNAKIEQMERDADELELGAAPSQITVVGVKSRDYVKGPHGRSASPKSRILQKQFSTSNISVATSAMSSLSCDHHDNFVTSEKPTARNPRRPSLHSVFEWNKEPSVRNLNSDPDPPAGEDNLLVNMSSVLVTPRHKLLRRSFSSSDVNQYNNTPQWPPNRRQKAASNLHSQFYRRETTLQTSNCANRVVESVAVETPQQLLKVMEPVSMREFLAFNGLSRDQALASRKNLDYGGILDNQSLASGQESSFSNRS